MDYLKGLTVLTIIIVFIMVTSPFMWGIMGWIFDNPFGNAYFEYCAAVMNLFKGG